MKEYRKVPPALHNGACEEEGFLSRVDLITKTYCQYSLNLVLRELAIWLLADVQLSTPNLPFEIIISRYSQEKSEPQGALGNVNQASVYQVSQKQSKGSKTKQYTGAVFPSCLLRFSVYASENIFSESIKRT